MSVWLKNSDIGIGMIMVQFGINVKISVSVSGISIDSVIGGKWLILVLVWISGQVSIFGIGISMNFGYQYLVSVSLWIKDIGIGMDLWQVISIGIGIMVSVEHSAGTWYLSWSSPLCFLPSYLQMRNPGWHTIKFPFIDDKTELVDLIPAEYFKIFEIYLHVNIFSSPNNFG